MVSRNDSRFEAVVLDNESEMQHGLGLTNLYGCIYVEEAFEDDLSPTSCIRWRQVTRTVDESNIEFSVNT